MTILLFVTRILTKGILDLPCLKPGGGGGGTAIYGLYRYVPL